MAIDQDDTMDYGNIYAFPQLTGKYANILSVVPTGAGWDANGELLINAGDKTITLGYGAGTINFVGGNQSWGGVSNFTTNQLNGNTETGSNPDQKIQVGIALPLGSGLVGARFSLSQVRHNYTDVYVNDVTTFGNTDYESEDKASQIKIEAGYGMEDAGPFKNVDLGVGLAINSGEVWEEDRNTDGDTTNSELAERSGAQTDGATDLSVRLRGVKEQGDGSLVFNLGFSTNGMNTEAFYQQDQDLSGDYQDAAGDNDETYRVEFTNTNISVGAAYNKPINDGGLLVISLRLLSSSYKWVESETFYDFADAATKTGRTNYTDEWSYLYLPLAVGVEDKLGENLKGRLGLKKNILLGYSETITDLADYDQPNDVLIDTETEEYKDTNNEDATLYMGLSATKGKFYSDWVIQHSIFWYGPDFLFGGNDGKAAGGPSFAAEWEVGLTF
jgi:hypothetical protein